jgi:chromosome segregation ATPase
MNLVGKILIVGIFIACVVFGSISSAYYLTARNWRTVAMQKPKELEAARAEKKSAEEKNKALNQQVKSEKDRQARDLAKLETERTELLRDDLADRKSISQKELDLQEAVKAVNTLQKRAGTLRASVAALTERVKTGRVERDAALKEILRLKDELFSAVDELSRLQKVAEGLIKELPKGT